MKDYYVNRRAQLNGDHEVHVPGCTYFPQGTHAQHLGKFWFCTTAVAEAKKYFQQSNGCCYCVNECHTQ